MLGAVLLLPLYRLTRPRAASGPVHTRLELPQAGLQAVWVDIRFSHAPEHFELFQGRTSLAEGGGTLRWDDDLDLAFDGEVTALRMEGRFPEEAESAYLEITLEPEGLRSLRRGLWTRGEFSHTLEFRWTEN